ncbi:MarR family transcriptional regulator, 2-MHQ and catechol-resistance regulon repressor [Carnobacterium iners]|uniref:MarR family transcriptional regulator, 2-MHQ and catechol-resistance regulon repressor n=1 Tax=Carnobacterium iners TaxID=1073423 RepID=A0A1X7N608_9LACT|nr:MarR family transcriptional regulator [Carnobacterium iners]SEK61927.1 MarR family transcriptional regulator, 2-MHQ and catechol-resistance regulon repressor [Carnobacterium iners]SMH31936.1 MarR family transcriptional regulator, 2-MHQ and catechol-resistance regulon repressor [Carnobacterium iners]
MKNELKSLIILFKAYNSIEKDVKHSLANTGINVNEFTAMEALYVKGSLTTQELIDTVLIPNSSMTYVLEILNKKAYIIKNKKESDKRIQIITLTVLGTKVFKEIYEKHFSYMRSIFDVLNKEEEQQLQYLLKKLGKKSGDKG